MAKRRSSTLTKMALDVLAGPDKFSTHLFAQEIGSSIPEARKALKYQALQGRVQALPNDFWIVVHGKTPKPESSTLQEQTELISKAFASIQAIIEENRWLRNEVEKWASIAKQAKIYHNGGNDA